MGSVEAGGLQMQRCVGMHYLGLGIGCRGQGQSWTCQVLRFILLS